MKLLVTGHSANVSSWPVAAVARVTPKYTFTGTHNLQQVPVPATFALVRRYRLQVQAEQSGVRLFTEQQRGPAPAGFLMSACAEVYDDEFDHMLIGIANVGSGLTPEDWEILTDLTVEQMSYRIKMRNAQFGFPIDPERERAICAGDGEPIEFDFERAGMTSD